MTDWLTQVEIEAVFARLELPLIERGIEEIRDAKDRFGMPAIGSGQPAVVQRLTVSNGTGKLPREEKKHAQLERRPL